MYVGDFSPNVRPVAATRAQGARRRRRGGRGAARGRAAEALSATDDVTYAREYEHLTLAARPVRRPRGLGDAQRRWPTRLPSSTGSVAAAEDGGRLGCRHRGAGAAGAGPATRPVSGNERWTPLRARAATGTNPRGTSGCSRGRGRAPMPGRCSEALGGRHRLLAVRDPAARDGITSADGRALPARSGPAAGVGAELLDQELHCIEPLSAPRARRAAATSAPTWTARPSPASSASP